MISLDKSITIHILICNMSYNKEEFIKINSYFNNKIGIHIIGLNNQLKVTKYLINSDYLKLMNRYFFGRREINNDYR